MVENQCLMVTGRFMWEMSDEWHPEGSAQARIQHEHQNRVLTKR